MSIYTFNLQLNILTDIIYSADRGFLSIAGPVLKVVKELEKGKMEPFVYMGLILCIGYLGIVFCDHFKIPRVIGYLLAGFLIGKSCLGVVNTTVNNHLEMATLFSLGVIGFTIGGELVLRRIKVLGPSIMIITLFESGMAFLLVFGGSYLVTKNLPLSLILGALASATAPAATAGVLWQYNARGPLSTTLMAVVGLDDAASLMIYAFASSIALNLLEHKASGSIFKLLTAPILEIFFSILLGALIGFVLHQIAKRIYNDEKILIVVLGAIVLGSGLALEYDLSLILLNMTMGFTLINLSRRNHNVFEIVHKFTPPFYLMFILLVGARLDIRYIPQMGLLGLVYLLTRFGGKYAGAFLGSTVSKAPEVVRKNLGFGLLAAAGVNIGLVIEISTKVAMLGTPESQAMSNTIIAVVIATVFVFDSIGPMLVKNAIFRSGEAKHTDEKKK